MVLGRSNMTPSRLLFFLFVLSVAGCDTMIADRLHVRVATRPQDGEAPSSRALTVVRDVLTSSGLERIPAPGPEEWWWKNPDRGPGVHATLHPHSAGLDVRLSQDLYGPVGPTPQYRLVKKALTEAASRAFGKGAVRVE